MYSLNPSKSQLNPNYIKKKKKRRLVINTALTLACAPSLIWEIFLRVRNDKKPFLSGTLPFLTLTHPSSARTCLPLTMSWRWNAPFSFPPSFFSPPSLFLLSCSVSTASLWHFSSLLLLSSLSGYTRWHLGNNCCPMQKKIIKKIPKPITLLLYAKSPLLQLLVVIIASNSLWRFILITGWIAVLCCWKFYKRLHVPIKLRVTWRMR